MKVWFMLIALFLLILAEMLLGAVAVALPLTLMGVVWFSAAWGWRYALGAAATGGWTVAALSGNAALVAVALAAAALTCWRRDREEADEVCRFGWRTGALLGLAAFAGALLSHPAAAVRLFGTPETAGAALLQLASSLVLSALLWPAAAGSLDTAAGWFGLPAVRTAGRRGGA